MNSTRTDTERLDALQSMLGQYSQSIACRWSESGRGWRLHESSKGTTTDIRTAIDEFLDANQKI